MWKRYMALNNPQIYIHYKTQHTNQPNQPELQFLCTSVTYLNRNFDYYNENKFVIPWICASDYSRLQYMVVYTNQYMHKGVSTLLIPHLSIIVSIIVLNIYKFVAKLCLWWFLVSMVLWPRKGSLMKTQTQILDNRLYYTRKIELHRKGKKSRTVRITPIVICFLAAKSLY